MNELERIWVSEDYKAKCEIAKANRASTTGGTQRKGGNISNTEHKKRLDEFIRRKVELSSEGGSPSVQSNQEEFNIWLDVIGGKNKKGRIYGFGSETDDDICMQRSSPSINSTSINTNIETELCTRITKFTQEIQQIRQEHQEMRQNYNKIMFALE
ncbi:uncharacterized protein LOC114729151 [Neltuma alba]|uniref:uncharacterized protein LOC114729151 n=1 Tax=Neltuma alba TaxID=207710 RepID=UPI0010A3DF53|nr:uncharacterized protein LOC114729151 [Prosopis alba]